MTGCKLGLPHTYLPMCRKMYDCIVMATGTLPPGVELIEVLEEAAEAEVAEVMASMPRTGDKLNAQDMVAAGNTMFASKAKLACSCSLKR